MMIAKYRVLVVEIKWDAIIICARKQHGEDTAINVIASIKWTR